MPESLHELCSSCTSARHAGRFDCLITSLVVITMSNDRAHCAWWQCCKGANQTHKGIKKMQNVCCKTNQDLCRIPGHATQASPGFVRNTWASAYRPQPRFLTNQPWPGQHVPVFRTYFNLYNQWPPTHYY